MISHLNRTLREWYCLSRNDRYCFLEELPALDCGTLLKTLEKELAIRARGRLRTKEELDQLERTRTPVPSVLELQRQGKLNEQALQWMFMNRRFFASDAEVILYRELPTCCAGEPLEGHGRADLLIFDQRKVKPVLVELKCTQAQDPLTGVILEVLLHWVFKVQHIAEFGQQLSGFGYPRTTRLGVAICAPSGYFEKSKTRIRKPRGNEFNFALGWIKCLKEQKNIPIDLYEVENDWLKVGPKFQMCKIQQDTGR